MLFPIQIWLYRIALESWLKLVVYKENGEETSQGRFTHANANFCCLQIVRHASSNRTALLWQVRTVVKNEMAAAIAECDVLLGAVAPTAAYKFGEKLSDPLSMYVGDLMTAGLNLSGARRVRPDTLLSQVRSLYLV